MNHSSNFFQSLGPVIPVLAFEDAATVVPIVEALQASGVNSIEITLRTPIALAAIEQCVKLFPNLKVGAGTVINSTHLDQVRDVGAEFALSPGLLPDMVKHADSLSLPFVPGVSTASEVMHGLELGLDTFKLFPASVVGGVPMLNALGGPLPQARFCPTGGVNEANMVDFLACKNVFAVGMTRLIASQHVKDKDWVGLERSIKSILATIN